MKVFSIDLYDYYKVKKPENGKGILYGYIADNNEEIDIDRKHPAMLVLPGGGYAFCSFREAEPICLKYLAFGFNAFYLDYSVAPVKFPYPLLEGVMAMNYIRENAKELNVDKGKVSSVGFSAGGHLCAMLGSAYDSEEVKKIFTGKENARPDAIILSYPVITYGEKSHNGSFENLCGEDENLRKKLDIRNLVNVNSSPAFIWATRNDGCVPVKSSLEIACAYEDKELPFSLHIWGKGTHGLATCDSLSYGSAGTTDERLLSKGTKKWVKRSVEWLEELGLYGLNF